MPPGCGVGLGAGPLTLCGARAGGTGVSVTVSVTTNRVTRGGDWFTRTRQKGVSEELTCGFRSKWGWGLRWGE